MTDNAQRASASAAGQNAPASPFAVITGASSGIGLELARQLAGRGHDLLLVAEDAGIQRVAAAISASGAQAIPLQADLRTTEGVHAVVGAVERAGRPVDVLALNAGVGVGGPFLETDLQEELGMIALNVTSVVHLAKHIVPRMVANGSGRVLFTASLVSELPAPFLAVYGATKAFVLSFSEALRDEIKDTGVSVTALQPGATDTNFFARADMLDTKVAQGPKDSPADVARDALEALFDGDDKVVAGAFRNRVISVLSHVAPETMKAAQHRKLAEPGSADA